MEKQQTYYNHQPYLTAEFNFFHLKKSLHSKRRELNKVILRAVSYIVLLRCRLIYNQHFAPYEHIYIYMLYVDKKGCTEDVYLELSIIVCQELMVHKAIGIYQKW